MCDRSPHRSHRKRPRVHGRAAIRVLEDGKVLSQSFHRHVVAPGQDYSQEDAKVQAICAAVHTPEVIAAYQTTQE